MFENFFRYSLLLSLFHDYHYNYNLYLPFLVFPVNTHNIIARALLYVFCSVSFFVTADFYRKTKIKKNALFEKCCNLHPNYFIIAVENTTGKAPTSLGDSSKQQSDTDNVKGTLMQI